MKKLFSILALIAFAGSVYAGCPSKPFHGKVVGFDEESKTLTVHKVKKKRKFKSVVKLKWWVSIAQLNLPKVHAS